MDEIMLETFNLLGSDFNFEVGSRSYSFCYERKTEKTILRKDIITVTVYGSESQPFYC
jgi:hypothetical protein